MLPEGFLNRMRRLLGDEFDEFLAAYAHPRNVGLRFNPLKAPSFPALPFLQDPIGWEANGFYCDPEARPGLHPYHEAGVYYLQEPSAMSAARLLDAQPGERVLDLCAAPGGKSTQLAAAMAGRGLLVCNEYHPGRAKILSRNIERMGISNALVLNETPAKLAAYFPRFFDKILVDAPCSGEGMFRKEEAAAADWSEQTVRHCAERQTEILSAAAQMLAPGGRLVYSTCTFAPEENEGVISAFLRQNPAFSVERLSCPWFAPGRPDWICDPMPGLEHTFRLWPHRLRGEGHYAAALRYDGTGTPTVRPLPAAQLPAEYLSFAADTLPRQPEGLPVLFGTSLYLAPEGTPDLHGLRVLRPGLELGKTQSRRFIPAHALALWLKSAANTVCLPSDSAELACYLRGETLPGTQSGWTLICADSFSIGWAKGADGILKNHYPKGLRRMG